MGERCNVLRKVSLPLVAAVAVGAVACSSGAPAPPAEPPYDGPPFEPVPADVYVAKVKNILTGLAPTEVEIGAVEADPGALGPLVDAWMTLPEYQQKTMRFFELAFQQTQITSSDFTSQVYAQLDFNLGTTPLLLQNIEESFARTMVEHTARGLPFTVAMTTDQVMMTTALKELYAFLDVWQLDNEGNVDDSFRRKNRNVAITVEASLGPIPIAESLDPTSPNYMHWYNPDVATPGTQIPECLADPSLLAPSARSLHYLLLGSVDGRKLKDGRFCQISPGTPRATQFAPGDFSDWTMVKVRPPNPGEETTVFYDLPALRTAHELVLSVPRVGFFSTPAFFANWMTNDSNQMRVTMHQTLIVATGSAIDGTDMTEPPGTPGLDLVHAGSGDCFGCHKILDPMRSIFSSTWSWNYHNQVDPTWISQRGMFGFRDVVQPVSSVSEFGSVLAGHPLLAPGFAQKLCYYVNSVPCDESDPEFARIVTLFRDSGYSWSTLVKALVTSPLTTFAAETKTRQTNDEVVGVSRRDHLCATLDARLGFTDVCGLDALGAASSTDPVVPDIVLGLPSDGYGRGAPVPILPNDPTVFYLAGLQNICESVAARVIDAAPGSPPEIRRWSSAQPDDAIRDFVSEVMALTPRDPRAAPAQELLRSHFASALKEPGITASDALRSTFVVACLSPSAVSIGL
jgi:hypothetical protein